MTVDEHQKADQHKNPQKTESKIPPGVVVCPLIKRPGMGHGPVVFKHSTGKDHSSVDGAAGQYTQPKDDKPKTED